MSPLHRDVSKVHLEICRLYKWRLERVWIVTFYLDSSILNPGGTFLRRYLSENGNNKGTNGLASARARCLMSIRLRCRGIIEACCLATFLSLRQRPVLKVGKLSVSQFGENACVIWVFIGISTKNAGIEFIGF